MGVVFVWWLAVELVGIASLPLAALVFARLPDRGWALAKPLGILVLGWLVWFPLIAFSALPYSGAWIVGTFLAFAAANALLWRRSAALRARLRELVARARGYIILTEALFAGTFSVFAWFRAFTPAAVDTEKFMDAAFLSALWRAPHLPAPDPWLSGNPINYYYFGHFLLASLAKTLGTQPGTAFNVGIALIFALTAIAVFAVAANLTAVLRHADASGLLRAAPFGLFAVFLVLLAGNLRGAQMWWHDAQCAAGVVSPTAASPCYVAVSPLLHGNPWAWWAHRELWPAYEWWPPSRAIPNTITEFPAFSFVLSDLHAHVLALPFAALAVGLALAILLGRGAGLRLFGEGRARWLSLGTTALCLGALYAINGWDLPTYLGLALLALGIQQWIAHGHRWSSRFALDTLGVGALLVALCLLLYLPFYRGFVSPSQGFAPVQPADRSLVGDELAIFGLPLFLLGTLLIVWLARWAGDALAGWWLRADADGAYGSSPTWAWLGRHARAIGAFLAVWVVGVFVLITLRSPDNASWTLFWCAALIFGCGALVLRTLLAGRSTAEDAAPAGRSAGLSPAEDVAPGDIADPSRAALWLFCLLGTAAALVASCELLYLRDIFNSRMNTVFKLYYQAWLLLGIAAAPALALLLPAARRILAAALAPSTAAVPTVSQASPATPALALAGLPTLAATPVRDDASSSGMAETRPAPEAPPPARAGGLRGRQALRRRGPPLGAWFTRRPLAWPLLPAALRWARPAGILCWMALLLALSGAALIYPILGASARTNNFTLPPHTAATLDGTAYMATDSAFVTPQCGGPNGVGAGSNLDDNYAIDWLNRHITGSPVILEAPGCEWTHFSRVSAFTGLPTLLGWPGGHEGEWRTNWPPLQNEDIFGERTNAINTIYTSRDEATVLSLLRHYSVKLVYVGVAERNLYSNANLDRFGAYLKIVYQRDGVTIYAVPY